MGIGTTVAKRSRIHLTAAFFDNVVSMWLAFTGSSFISMITTGERTLKDFILPIDQSQDRHRLKTMMKHGSMPDRADWQII